MSRLRPTKGVPECWNESEPGRALRSVSRKRFADLVGGDHQSDLLDTLEAGGVLATDRNTKLESGLRTRNPDSRQRSNIMILA